MEEEEGDEGRERQAISNHNAWSINFASFYIYDQFLVCVCVCVYKHDCATVYVTEWNSQDTCGSCFSIHSVGPGD